MKSSDINGCKIEDPYTVCDFGLSQVKRSLAVRSLWPVVSDMALRGTHWEQSLPTGK